MPADYATVASLFVQRLAVRVGDMAVSNHLDDIISTYALGSCVGVVAYDSIAKVGGILHLMLPDSAMAPEKARHQPALFANTGLPMFFRALATFRTNRSRLRLFVGGGASVLDGPDSFRIGERNVSATMAYLAQAGLPVRTTELGGIVNRTVHLEVASGIVSLRTSGENRQFSLAV